MEDLDKNIPMPESDDGEDVLSDLEALSKKYGLSFDADRYKTSAQNNRYTPHTPDSEQAKNFTPPKNNRPARTPRIVYDGNSASGVKIVYEDFYSRPQGPQGKRVVYQEAEEESIVEKRRRNAAMAQQRNNEELFKPTASYSERNPDADVRISTPVSPAEKAEMDEMDKFLADDSYFEISSEKDENATQKRVHQHYELTTGQKIANFFKAFIPWKGDSGKEIARKIVMDISAVVVIVCFGVFLNNYLEHQQQLNNQSDIEGLKVSEAETDELDAQWAAIKAKYPDIDFPEGMNIKYAELYAANQDLVGWLHIDNTNIDTSVVHHPDDRNSSDEDLYLHHNFYGAYDKYGNAYLDAYNSGAYLDKNNIIYGHNMTDGLAFAQLEKYYEIEGFQDSPIIKYSTLFEDYYFKVYAVIVTNGMPSGDNGYLFSYITAHFASDENFESFIEALDERKLYDTGVDINKDDVLITLSTCSYEIKSTQMGRLAIIGRLVREGESLDVDTSLAVYNENVRYPQIWYDEHNMTNPYKDAYRWEAE